MGNNNNALEGLIAGIGAIAEMTKIAHEAFQKVGFSEEDALYLAGEFMTIVAERGLSK